MKIVLFGLSISSAWGNGHASTYRALVRALEARGHDLVFFERDDEWFASNRDLPEPSFCKLELFDSWRSAHTRVRHHLNDADVVVLGSYFPDGILAADELLDSRVPVKAFYDIDTPITAFHLRAGLPSYLRAEQLAAFHVYFSFTGGPLLTDLKERFGVRKAIPLYCSFDPDLYRPMKTSIECDLSYMGTYAEDRQQKLDVLLRQTALAMPHRSFRLAGAKYPESFRLPANVEHSIHISPRQHPDFYSSSRMTLNLTRREMVNAGYSPSVRLFEAAACGSVIVSDFWPGLETFLVPGKEILIAETTEEMKSYLEGYSPTELDSMGARARERVLAEHHPDRRAELFENAIFSLEAACA